MKLATFTHGDGTQEVGVLTEDGGRLVVLQAGVAALDGKLSPFFSDMLAFLRGGAAARDKAQAVVEYVRSQELSAATVALDEVRLLAPVPRPESVRDCMSFEQHIINIIRAVGLKRLAPLDELIEKRFGRERT
ncbi:MAG: fumarylacetoacetate hydrolase family protein, partial [Ardenticatenaceae bacterium]